jgi:hypothetical protein
MTSAVSAIPLPLSPFGFLVKLALCGMVLVFLRARTPRR